MKKTTIWSIILLSYSCLKLNSFEQNMSYKLHTEQIVNSSSFFEKYNHDSYIKLKYTQKFGARDAVSLNLKATNLKETSFIFDKQNKNSLNYIENANIELKTNSHNLSFGISPNINSQTFYNSFFYTNKISTFNNLFDFVDYKKTRLSNNIYTSSYSNSNNFNVSYYNKYLADNYNTLIAGSYTFNEHNIADIFDTTIAYFNESYAIAYDIKINYRKYKKRETNLNDVFLNNEHGALTRISYLGFTVLFSYKNNFLENNQSLIYETKLQYQIHNFMLELNYLNSKLEQYKQENMVYYTSLHGMYKINNVFALKGSLFSYTEKYNQENETSNGALLSLSATLQ